MKNPRTSQRYQVSQVILLLLTQEAKRALKRAADGSGELQRLDSGARTNSEEALPREEVIRRLRLLGQPATVFGEVLFSCPADCQSSAQAHAKCRLSLEHVGCARLCPRHVVTAVNVSAA